jgi:N,N-dimethylformamidase
VFFETANGGAVFSTGSIVWMSSTLDNQYKNDVATITSNVIKRFLDPKPFPAVPETSLQEVERGPKNPEYEHADQR